MASTNDYDVGEHLEEYDKWLPPKMTIHKVNVEKHYNAVVLSGDEKYGIVLRYAQSSDSMGRPGESRVRSVGEEFDLVKKANHEFKVQSIWERASYLLKQHGFKYWSSDGMTHGETERYWTRELADGWSVVLVSYRPADARGRWDERVQVSMDHKDDDPRGKGSYLTFPDDEAMDAAHTAVAFAENARRLIGDKEAVEQEAVEQEKEEDFDHLPF